MTRFERAFQLLIGHEGGYVHDPHDVGGETKFGIAKRFHPTVDIKNLTLDGARSIYRRKYWGAVRADELPPSVALVAFDAAVNCGETGTAQRMLQQAARVPVDGVIGPITLAAAKKPGVAKAMHIIRTQYQTTRKTWPHHSKGWAIRLATLPWEVAEFAREFGETP